MSKRVKTLLERDVRTRLQGADSCVVVACRGLSGPVAVRLRRTLRQQGVRMLVVKNSLARRALRDGPLAPATSLLEGPSAICWGGEDAIGLARAVQDNAGRDGPLAIRGASVEGRVLTAEQTEGLAQSPPRLRMVAEVVARACAPAQRVVSLTVAGVRRVAAQIKRLAEEPEAGGVRTRTQAAEVEEEEDA